LSSISGALVSDDRSSSSAKIPDPQAELPRSESSALIAPDVVLMRAVMHGDGDAQRVLATRLVVRVRRSAHAFMRGSPDAEDAAQHALIELLRSAHTYRRELTLETWADRLAARSILRFGRAMRRRAMDSGKLEFSFQDEPTTSFVTPGRFRNLDEYLSGALPARREVLLLKHALGHGIDEIAEITQASPSMVRDRLLSAQRELRQEAETRRGPDPTTGGDMETGSERWGALRDRETLGEVLRDAELKQIAELERSDADVRRQVAKLRELAAYLETRVSDRDPVRERDLVERSLDAVQVTSQPLRTRAGDPDADVEREIDPEGPRWIRSASLSLSVLLALTAVVALVLYEPRSNHVMQGSSAEPGRPALAPTVEALTSAHTAKRGARLRRGKTTLGPGAALSAGQELSAGDKPGCIVLEPNTHVCLAPSSTLRIVSLALASGSVEVVRGRVVATHEGQPGGFEIRAGDVRVRALGTVFGVERSDDAQTVRVRVLEGRVEVRAPFATREAGAMQSAVVRLADQASSVESLGDGPAQREWELRATDAAPQIPPAVRVNAPAAALGAAPAAPSPAPEIAPPAAAAPAAAPQSDPRALLQSAWELVKNKRWSDAARLYQSIQRDYPGSDEAHAVLVRIGDLQLEHLNAPASSLVSFERYLDEGGGPLELEAQLGRIEALGRLHKTNDERAAIQAFLDAHPASLKSEALRERLQKLHK
jgi:RNA polymerase sigma-70 factor (ECF subfamily)